MNSSEFTWIDGRSLCVCDFDNFLLSVQKTPEGWTWRVESKWVDSAMYGSFPRSVEEAKKIAQVEASAWCERRKGE